MVLEPEIPGGQAGTSSLIRNYLGFQRGISGEELAVRAVEQAWLFGADFVLTQPATGISASGDGRVVRTADGTEVEARAVVIATRGHLAPARGARAGGARGPRRLLRRGRRRRPARWPARTSSSIGAGNSAGQAALHLARYARSVTMVVRGPGLGATMSDYLVTGHRGDPEHPGAGGHRGRRRRRCRGTRLGDPAGPGEPATVARCRRPRCSSSSARSRAPTGWPGRSHATTAASC